MTLFRESPKLPRFFLSFLLVSAAAGTAEGEAQLIRGHLVDRVTGSPVSGARIELIKGDELKGYSLTDSAGFFRLPVPQPGDYVLEATSLGYARSRSHSIDVHPPDTITVEFAIHPEAILLEPLIVTAKSSYGRASFRKHMEEWGKGVFFTPEMVDSINPRHPADVLHGADKTHFVWRWGQGKAVPSIRTFLGHGCLAYMLNRLPVSASIYPGIWENSPLALIRGEDIVAVEYYRHISEVPRELLHFAEVGGAYGLPRMCGLVVFWTRAAW
jgi:hypothetical protein